jgi:hypothetical protein
MLAVDSKIPEKEWNPCTRFLQGLILGSQVQRDFALAFIKTRSGNRVAHQGAPALPVHSSRRPQHVM